jgi:hypothetical protein
MNTLYNLLNNNNNNTNNHGYFTLRPIYTYICDNNSLSSYSNQKLSDKSCRENQNTYLMFNNFFRKKVPFMRKCGKIL